MRGEGGHHRGARPALGDSRFLSHSEPIHDFRLGPIHSVRVPNQSGQHTDAYTAQHKDETEHMAPAVLRVRARAVCLARAIVSKTVIAFISATTAHTRRNRSLSSSLL